MALLQQLELLLAQMLSPENEVRAPAEKQYEQIALDQKGTLLFQVYLNPSAKSEVRKTTLHLSDDNAGRIVPGNCPRKGFRSA